MAGLNRNSHAKRKARGYKRFATMRTVLFLIAGKLDFAQTKPQTL